MDFISCKICRKLQQTKIPVFQVLVKTKYGAFEKNLFLFTVMLNTGMAVIIIIKCNYLVVFKSESTLARW